MMKKAFALLLALVICLSLAACGNKEKYVSNEEFLSYVDVVELNSENYMDYLEFVEYDELDSFDEPTGDRIIGVKLKDGYTSLKDSVLIKVAYSFIETERKYDEESSTWNRTQADEDRWTYSDETDVSLWDNNALSIHRKYSEGDGISWEYDFTDLRITKVSGWVYKVEIPDELWQANEDGSLRVGTKESNISFYQSDAEFTYAYAVEQALIAQGTDVSVKVYDITGGAAPNSPEASVSESDIPETTAAPEPVYETIEITMDNWKEYFEFRQSEGQWMEDAFGDAERYVGAILFAVKEESLDVINPATIDIAFIFTYVKEYRYIETDFENRIFTIGETVAEELLGGFASSVGAGESPAKKMTGKECLVWYIDSFKSGNMYLDANGADMIGWPDSLDISRIQGTIEIQTN